MHDLLQALRQLWESLGSLFLALAGVLLPWTPLAAWIAFWLYSVNWQKLRPTLAKGGWTGVFLLGALTVLVWGTISPSSVKADVYGLLVSNYVEKTVYVSALICIMFFCGSLQLSGFCGECCRFEEQELVAEDHHGGHAADDHGHDHAPAHGGHH